MVEVWSMHNPTIREIFIINKARTFQPVEEEQALHNGVKLFLKEMLFYETIRYCMRAIISRGLYIFYPIFQCGL